MVQTVGSDKKFRFLLTALLLQAFLAVWVMGVYSAHAGQSQSSPNSKGAPRIQIDRDFVDYGTVPIEQMIVHRTIIKNVGDAPLVLEKGCDEHEGMIHTSVLEGC